MQPLPFSTIHVAVGSPIVVTTSTFEESFEALPNVETRSLLAIQRFNINIWRPIDIGIEYRMLEEMESGDRRAGWLSEAMWNLGQNLRFGIGYNFTDFSDNAFSQNDYSVSGWFFRVQGTY